MEYVVVLPNQLFEKNDLIKKYKKIILYEHPVYFTKYRFHKLKLILHRASMQWYKKHIEKEYNAHVTYIEFHESLSITKNDSIHLYDPVDVDVIESLKKYTYQLHETPLFLCSSNDLAAYKKEHDGYNHATFYTWQRKRLDILLTKEGKPRGGHWSYDEKNRNPFPENFSTDPTFTSHNNEYITEAQKYVDIYFPQAYGNDNWYLPIDSSGAKQHVKKFLQHRLDCFGPYQDAVNSDIIFGCHSVISPLLNIGLITPAYVLQQTLKYAENNAVPLASLEAFIRQLVGWREYVRFVYVYEHDKLITLNYFDAQHTLSKKWYTAKTGLPPIDMIIQKVLTYGYAHHIERLMYVGTIFLLTDTDPKKVYTWFMELFVDSYQWVMEPNVYGMSQHSAGPLMMNRPYMCSSNYVTKMSNYTKRKNAYPTIGQYQWFDVWDALYYHFIAKHHKTLKKNYATARSVGHWERMKHDKKKKLAMTANYYLQHLLAQDAA